MDLEAKQIIEEVRSRLSEIQDLNSLKEYRFEMIDRKDAVFAQLASKIKDLPKEERKDAGQSINSTKNELEALFAEKEKALKDYFYATLAERELIDLTVARDQKTVGHLHPVTAAYFEIVDIFKELGFHFASGPEVEWFYYAFEALNMPITHAASDEFETYYIDGEGDENRGRPLLRPHTSPVQIRTMEKQKPPIRVVVPGKTYRPQSDISHTPMFHQFEGLLIDQNVSVGELVGTLDYFVKRFFRNEGVRVRIRPYHFRFTEPSFEVDISCMVCNGVGCRLCKEGWLELGGAGMVHPEVLQYGGIDASMFNGFAFGWGIERIVVMRSGIPDLRMLYEGELRLLKQF